MAGRLDGHRGDDLDGERVLVGAQADVGLLAHGPRRDADGLDRRGVGQSRDDEERLGRHRPGPALGGRIDVGGIADRLDHGEHPPPHRGVVDEAVAGLDARTPGESGAGEAPGGAAVLQPGIGQGAAGVPERLEPVAQARETYSPLRVSTRTVSPASMNSGTWIAAPVSSVAGLVPPPETVSPFTPGSVWVTWRLTALGSW